MRRSVSTALQFCIVALTGLALACTDERASDTTQDTQPRSDISTPADDAGEAVAVIRAYYDAVAARDYARAYALWADEGAASGQSFAEFRRGYAETASVEVDTGEPGRIEPAAGSRYIRVPVEVNAVTTDGTRQCFRGEYVLRRGVIPGASAAEREWRIHSAELAPCASRPAGGSRNAHDDRGIARLRNGRTF